ncbi:MAG: UvrD-helicase domain-containing protein [Gammaproteobacteria bacterium]|nr:UvrD-helicase domain-containing protein [Gammaproteobacteria bacterium]
MAKPSQVADHRARTQALDASRSFVVQAPAGSGKTELLIQRFLVLLAGAEVPEEIIAITFTRKAAGEMRDRILLALESARSEQAPEDAHERHTWQLARRALTRDTDQSWELLDNPARLRIQTIDALCASLSRQMPVLSRFGALPEIVENAQPLYLEAAGNTLADLESNAEWSDAVATLVQHMDNRLDRLQGLVAAMLASRDRWLRHIVGTNDPKLQREMLEAAMAHRITEVLGSLVKLFPAKKASLMAELACFAASNLSQDDASAIPSCADLKGLPGPDLKDRTAWEGIAALLLTQKGDFRKTVTKKQGFPSKSSSRIPDDKVDPDTMKAAMQDLLEDLQGEEALREKLGLLQAMPPASYGERDWEIVQALVQLLRMAAAHLEVVFSERGQVDFTALVQAATRALGEPEAPTDLALAVDHRIQHLLVDEFQDTSFSQYELLVRLTAGWQPNDGRTLFVVGDPMQSIYRFREAEVGLFLTAVEHGIGQVPLQPLQLKVNFRSQQGIVDWINTHFPSVLPGYDDANEGAVSYAESTPFHPAEEGTAVTMHLSQGRDDVSEAHNILSLVEKARARHPQGTVAILVRARTHLAEITTHLKRAGLRFQAVEIERLDRCTVVQDLLALTRALSHPGDRIAWLAVLRAPCCGLTLADLHGLACAGEDRTIIDLLGDAECIARLSKEGQVRIARILPILERALSERERSVLRSRVEGVWIALGGPACVHDRTDLEDAESFFRLLEKLGKEEGTADLASLEKRVEQLFAAPDAQADESIQVMTMHKAKGLEFDTVIVPGLSRIPPQDDSQLLHWLEHRRETGERELVLAPINAHGEESISAKYLRRIEKMKRRLEDGRLLYVAATRAKRQLHLLGSLVWDENKGTQKDPNPDSLMAHLYPHAVQGEGVFEGPEEALPPTGPRPSTPASEGPFQVTGRLRLTAAWQLPQPPESIEAPHPPAPAVDPDDVIPFEWAGETAMAVGTVVHRLLQQIGTIGIERLEPADRDRLEQTGHELLKQMAIPEDRLDAAYADVREALQSTLQDDRGQWILSGQHHDAGCELALSARLEEGVDHIVIDRTFNAKEASLERFDLNTTKETGGRRD